MASTCSERQEVLHHQLQTLHGLLPEYAFTGRGRDDGKDRGEHVAIFYRKDRFQLVEHGDFWLSENPAVPGKGWDAGSPADLHLGQTAADFRGSGLLRFQRSL